MKKALIVAGVALAGFTAAFAQDIKQKPAAQAQAAPTTHMRAVDIDKATRRVEPETIAQRKADRLDKELSFSAEQKQKVQALFLKEAQENKGRARYNKETDEQLKAIFTAEQRQKYETMKNQRKQEITERAVQSRAADLKKAPAVGN